ncbi:MAG: SulP family inorganic anion transporter [Trueperaceae bacterium]|nr:SulP family inorganic anion transporter [Trueperaceae bacterium]
MTGTQRAPQLAALVFGLVVGVVLIAASVSVGTLVYGGVAPEQLTLGVRLALLGTAATGLVVALVGSLPGSVAQVQGATGAILATLAVTAVAGVPGDDPATRFATVLTLVATTSFAVGGAFVLIGGLRLGRVVRYLPYPVVGGFVAGTGWLLVLGGGAVASGAGARSSSLAAALPLDRVEHWLPALALGAVLTFATPRGRSPFVFPALLAGAVAVVYAAMAWTGGSPRRGAHMASCPMPATAAACGCSARPSSTWCTGRAGRCTCRASPRPCSSLPWGSRSTAPGSRWSCVGAST